MASRQNYLDAQRASFKSSSRIGAATRMDHSSDDVAAISQAGKIKSDMLSKKSYMQNLHSARSYLKFQEAGYQKVFSIYQRMEELSSESLLQPKDAQNPANKEFEELKKQLVDIKNSKMNGISIFDPVATCGNIVDIEVEGSALDYTSKDPAVSHTVRGISTDIAAYGGKLSFNVNSGGAGEIYRVFMGNHEIFSTGPSFQGNNPTNTEINEYTQWTNGTTIKNNNGVVYNGEIYVNKSGPGNNTPINASTVTPNLNSVEVDPDPSRDFSEILQANGQYGKDKSTEGPLWKNGNTIRNGKGVTHGGLLYQNISGADYTIANSSIKPNFDTTNWSKVSWLNTDTEETNLDTNNSLQSTGWGNDSWRTSGSADDGDPDKITLEFGPGVETTYSIELGNSNNAEGFNTGTTPQSNLYSAGGVIRTNDLGENSTETVLTVHVETISIGIVGDPIEFEPKFFDKQLDIDTSGNQVALKAVGFETFENFSIDSSSDAKKTSDKLLGMGDMMGEIECIGGNWLPKIASAINRIDSEILAAESNTLSNEIALGRIVGSDMALETTNHAKQMLKMDMAAFVMSNTTRINDVLAPLTTDHHRSELMSGDALL
jgi:flagellin-like hook-associated protein FlgL